MFKTKCLLLCFSLLVLAAPAHAKNKPAKPQQAQKEKLVLMPLRLDAELQNMQGAMETALVEGLQQKFTVISGEQVAKKAREIFMKETTNTAHKECDETRCLQGITEYFQAEILAVANVTKIEGGYLLALSIRNLYDNIDVYSKSLPCKGCDAFQAVEKIKELVGTPAPAVAAAPTEPEAPKVTATDPDSVTWNEAQKGNTVDDYQVYVDAYPKGKYIAFAKAKIKKLKEAALAAAEQQEQNAWDAAQQENSEASLNRYLQGYPNGRFAAFAKTRLSKLKTDLAYKEEADLWNKAESGMDKAAVESYLSKYPSGRYISAASTKLKAIKEEEAKGPAMVKIPGRNYEIGKYEVTQKEWRDVMGSNPSNFKQCGDNCPVEQVSWNDIQEFLQKLNAKTGRQYRLPTEAEWEYACHGGSQTEYCGSNDIDSVAWYNGNSGNQTHPVGQKQANGYGLYDMSGNVWEWMENLYDSSHPEWGRALRGGSRNYEPQLVRAAIRIRVEPSLRSGNLGFRLARTLP